MFLVTASCDVFEDDVVGDPECFNPQDAWNPDKCSFAAPQFCGNVKGFLGVAGPNRNKVKAGGNRNFGRRDFVWDSGGELALRYAKRNVFGISTDFAEDVTKTNWGVEFTWIGATPYLDSNSYETGITDSDSLNLTVSVDRPTFINFLNANRTFFFNTQWFFQYLTNYNSGFPTKRAVQRALHVRGVHRLLPGSAAADDGDGLRLRLAARPACCRRSPTASTSRSR